MGEGVGDAVGDGVAVGVTFGGSVGSGVGLKVGNGESADASGFVGASVCTLFAASICGSPPHDVTIKAANDTSAREMDCFICRLVSSSDVE